MPNKPIAADFVAKKSDSPSPGPQNDFDRIIRLCGLLQDYRDGARRWSDAGQVKYEAIRADRNRQISGDELRRAVLMFDVLENTIQSYVGWLNEFHHLIVMHKLISLLPSLEESRITCMPPHTAESFDWQAFRRELLAVRDEATRLRSAQLTALDSDKTPDGEQQPPKPVRRLNVQKVQGSERSFKIDRKPVTLSPACANILNGFIALKESGEPATPANLMTKLSPKYDKNRKRFEDDKGRFNDALEAVGIAKGLYVVGDVFQLCKPPKKTPAKAVKQNGMKTIRQR